MSKPPTKNENKVIDFFTRKPYDIDHFNNHDSSGIALADFVTQVKPNGLVIDAGCGAGMPLIKYCASKANLSHDLRLNSGSYSAQ